MVRDAAKELNEIIDEYEANRRKAEKMADEFSSKWQSQLKNTIHPFMTKCGDILKKRGFQYAITNQQGREYSGGDYIKFAIAPGNTKDEKEKWPFLIFHGEKPHVQITMTKSGEAETSSKLPVTAVNDDKIYSEVLTFIKSNVQKWIPKV